MVFRSVFTLYIVALTISRLSLGDSTECTEFFTLLEERSCGSANTTEIKPAIINPTTWNISKYNVLHNSRDSYLYPSEDCFLELKCDYVETVCHEPVYDASTVKTTENTETIETTESAKTTETTSIEPTTELETLETTTDSPLECRHFATYFEVISCDTTNSTVVKPATSVEDSSMQHIFTDNPSCPFGGAPEEHFLQLVCEDVVTVCGMNSTTITGKITKTNSSMTNAWIAIGAICSVGAASYLTYYTAGKIKDIVQSGTYYLPK
ncbi:unnamed protein product, partial [Iphiclides podalirius]